MRSKHVCPKCGGTRFITVFHAAQDWLVDEEENFIKEVETTEIIAEADDESIWSCAECGIEGVISSFM